jgi:AcrR family transcriptional regulator
MKTVRRSGGEGDRTRTAILDATESIMREEGYAAVSSRRVAERAGLQPSLVHYHFGTMEDLFLALYKRTEDAYLARHVKALTADNTLTSLWEFNTDMSGTVLVLEFIALASHHKAVRDEIKRSGEIVRNIETAFFSRLLERLGVSEDDYPPAVLSFVIAAVARAFVTEETLGISTGHAEVLAFLRRRLRELESRGGEGAAKP